MRTILVLLLMGLAAVVLAEALPSPGLLDARIRVVSYSADQVYVLKGFVGYQTDLEFETGERFVGLGAGDIDGISFVAEGNHLFLKPKAAKVGTNLTIVTSRRTYQLDYSATTTHPDASEEVTYALRFTYPASDRQGSEAGARALDTETARPKNIDYWFCGAPSIMPVAASDDGVYA